MDDALGLDVVALGALNVDLIATQSEARDDPVEDTETLTTIEEIEARVGADDLAPDPYLGGSAFNAVTMLAQLGTKLRLGMVGISAAGSNGVAESHAERLAKLDVVDLTRASERRPGLCLALSERHGRHLRTAPEANLEIADYLSTDDELSEIVASARVLHLTSLLEDPLVPGTVEVASAVASFVERAMGANPDLILSFDPGRTWVDGLAHLPQLRRLYGLANVLYVSPQELAHLARHNSGHGDPASLLGLCLEATYVVVKSLHAILVRRASGAEVGRVPRLDRALAVDSTGAGDGVAAGVLAALGGDKTVVEGCHLGLRIAARRVSDYGDRGHVGLQRAVGLLWPSDSGVAL